MRPASALATLPAMRIRLLLLLVPALLSALPVAAQTAAARVAERRACLELAVRSPAEGAARADAWARQGGGYDARLCRATADFARGAFRPAAEAFEQLAVVLGPDDPVLRAGLLARAGQARARGKDFEIAERLYGDALALQPADADLWIDRALLRTETERFWDAIADLDRAVALDPGRPEVWRYRAQAKAALDLWDPAVADVDRALALLPGDPDARLLRGNLFLRLGNVSRAATDWGEVMRIAPGTPAGRAAAANLQRLQSGPDRR
ncbi:MAG: tetratricopeptide repeat protein [Rhodospirillales bacterium]